ncbi:hypothetical protein EIP91_002342 [Steccherinum ochraceum]|uniref:WD repeat-containing protein 75 second beta-propeller domain-containing protein n=1 Tax=Steccherinum ochraceum TaxID=92696 RepID=A0A4R0RKS6_9APHY|nr:hypothetical protein EIP91_002342 [Steccherinum ochraceum]
MAASNLKKAAHPSLHDASPSDPPKSTKRPRKKAVEQAQVEPVPGSSKSTQSKGWTWRSLTTSASSRVPLLFTKDSNYFFSANGPSVKIYNVSTGRIISTLYPPQHASTSATDLESQTTVTCMALNPQNSFQLITGSSDGLIRIWDFVDAILLKTFDVGKPVVHLAVHERFRDEIYVSVARPGKKVNRKGTQASSKNDNAHILRVLLKPTNATANSTVQKPVEAKLIGKTRGTAGLAISPSGSWLVVAASHKAYVASTSDLQAGFTKFVSPEKLTCLAFHPSEEYFATGDQKGVVRLWYCLNENISTELTGTEKKAPTTTLHWHSHAVSSLAFTANGAYLVTGGEEAVLVIWQLHTGKKEFVPRIGAPIAHVAVSSPKNGEEEYLVGLADGSFVFIRSGTFKISRSIARIKIDPAISNNRPIVPAAVPLAIHPLPSTLILPSSHPSMLQTYNPSTSELISELEVTPSNKVSRRDEKQLDPPRVERAVVSESGLWMATVDGRSGDEAYRGEVYLKVWSWDKKGGSWILNTRIDRPHGLKLVTSVAFRPQAEGASQQLVTTGADGAIKVWRLRQVTKEGKKVEEYWVAQATLGFRAEIPSDACWCWSSDGSLLAVILGPYIGLYDGKEHYAVLLWDIITQRVRWHYKSNSTISRVVGRGDEENFVVFEQSPSETATTARLSVFKPSSATPVSVQTLPFQLLSVAACPPSWHHFGRASSFPLVGITQSWNVVALGDRMRLPHEEGSSGVEIKTSPSAVKPTLFEDIFGASIFAAPPPPLPLAHTTTSQPSSWKGKDVEKVFDAPSYLMPPLDALFDPLLQSFLVERPPERANEAEAADADDADDRMDEDGPILVGNRLERIVDSDEMVAMIDLFKMHAIQAPKPAVNGVHVNGIHKPGPQVNGISHSAASTPLTKHKPSHLPSTASKPAPAASPAQSTTASPSVRAGQKRKKSLG